MDDAVPRTQQNDELAALTNLLAGEILPEAPEVVLPQTPSQVLAAPQAPAPQAVAPPEAVTEPPVAPEEVPNYTFKPKLDEDWQAILEEPDFEEEARSEIAAELADDDGEYEYADPEVAAKLRTLEKRNAFLESQVVAKSKRGWIEEAKRAYPDLARLIPGELEGIAATSRRAFAREADKINAKYAAVLAEPLAKLEAARQAIAQGAVATARAEVANAWGKPAGDVLPALAAATQDALTEARSKGDFEGSIKALMGQHPVL